MQRAQAETTSQEFVEWQLFFRQELKRPTREELYLAQIAAECRRFVAKSPGTVHLGQFILPLKMERKVVEDDEPDEDTEVARVATSKAFWKALLSKKKVGK